MQYTYSIFFYSLQIERWLMSDWNSSPKPNKKSDKVLKFMGQMWRRRQRRRSSINHAPSTCLAAAAGETLSFLGVILIHFFSSLGETYTHQTWIMFTSSRLEIYNIQINLMLEVLTCVTFFKKINLFFALNILGTNSIYDNGLF